MLIYPAIKKNYEKAKDFLQKNAEIELQELYDLIKFGVNLLRISPPK